MTPTDELTKRELLARLADLIMECEPETPEEVDEYLRDAGYDPDELVTQMRQRIDAIIAQRKQELEADNARKSG